jgi:hypothetical protein
VLLRSLDVKIQEFEVNRHNDIRVKDVLEDIYMLGKEIEEKIYEKFKFTKDQRRFMENKDNLEECFEKLTHICDRKGVYPDIKFRSIDERMKKGFFIEKEEVVFESQNEIKLKRTIFSELKGVKDSSKKAMLD